MTPLAADLGRLDGVAQAELVRSGEVHPSELVASAVERIDQLNPTLGAVIHRFDERALAAARSPIPAGPFTGVPFLLKDGVAHSAGDPFHAGMRFLRDRAWTETDDAELVARTRRAGLLLVGKTNLPELASVMTTEPLAYGPTRNPWDTARTASGSSGGSAAAVASGMVPIAHGNDMGGSIRGPASACGLVGLKPSRARGTLAPAFGEYWGPTTHEGALTRSVRDTAAFVDAISGAAPGDPYTAPPLSRPLATEVGVDPGHLRIGIRAFLPGTRTGLPHAESLLATEAAAALLEDLGHVVDAFGPVALNEPVDSVLPLFAAFIARDVERWAERTGATRDEVAAALEPHNAFFDSYGRTLTASQHLAALEDVQHWARRVVTWWADGWDLLLTPTSPEPPHPLGQDPLDVASRMSVFTMPFNLTGQPAISLPLHWSEDGLPVGIQLIAAPGREDLLIRVASQLEVAQPWAARWPPVNAVGGPP